MPVNHRQSTIPNAFPALKRTQSSRVHKKGHRRNKTSLSTMAHTTEVLAEELRRQRQSKLHEMERAMNATFEDEYRCEVEDWMFHMEGLTTPSVEMMDMQPDLQWYMRPHLIDFLIEIHHQLRLSPSTLHLAINLIDRYTSRRVVYRKHYQLVGVAALWIAAKYEDSKEKVPTVRELRAMCCGAYEEDMFLQMEVHVLNTCEWSIGHPTADSFLQLLLSDKTVVQRDDSVKTVHLARYLNEIALFTREFLKFQPSVIANAALLLSRHILGQRRQPATPQGPLRDCIALFADSLDHGFPCLLQKYTSPALGGVALILKDYLLAAAAPRTSSSPSPVTPPRSKVRPSMVRLPAHQNGKDMTPPSTPGEEVEVLHMQYEAHALENQVQQVGLPTPPVEVDQESINSGMSSEACKMETVFEDEEDDEKWYEEDVPGVGTRVVLGCI
ncbi:hypothetical protein YB2330_004283 [Saitoella coloradoensis]